MSRIKSRGRTYQQQYPADHLRDISALYDEWLSGAMGSIFTISSDKWDWRSPEVLRDIAQELQDVLSWQPTTEVQLELFSDVRSRRNPPQLSFFRPKTDAWHETPRPIGPLSHPSHKITAPRYPSVYIAAPFTGHSEVQCSSDPQIKLFGLETAHGRLLPGRYRSTLLEIRTVLREKLGLDAILPHWDINRWGRRRLSSREVVRECTAKVRQCDCFVGLLGESHGSHFEFGIAEALGKPCVLVRCDEIADSFIAGGVQGFQGGLLVVTCDVMDEIPRLLVSSQVKDFLKQFVPIARRK